MEARDLFQLIAASLAFPPAVLILERAVGQSLLVSKVSPLLAGLSGFVDQVIWLHSFLVIFGVGLLIGVRSLTVNVLIAAGLGGVVTLTETVSKLLDIIVNPMPIIIVDSLSPYVEKPITSDLYVILPLILIPLGLLRWRSLKRRDREKFREEALEAIRTYCPSCGVYVDPNVDRCLRCGAEVEKRSDSYCASCGRPIGGAAKYCSWCGEEVAVGLFDIDCPRCRSPLSIKAKFCRKCGARLPYREAEQIAAE